MVLNLNDFLYTEIYQTKYTNFSDDLKKSKIFFCIFTFNKGPCVPVKVTKITNLKIESWNNNVKKDWDIAIVSELNYNNEFGFTDWMILSLSLWYYYNFCPYNLTMLFINVSK